MNAVTVDTLRGALGRIGNTANAQLFCDTLHKWGPQFGLDRKVRLAELLGQLSVESENFTYSREIWGPTKQQLRYDPASGSSLSAKLGNTSVGDGKKYSGRDFIQVTGKSNYRQLTEWGRKLIPGFPDFVANPELLSTPDWVGIGTIFFWSTRNLNYLADTADTKAITRVVNGGYTHLSRREAAFTGAGLYLLGYDREDVKGFQLDNKLDPDGKAGPLTRAAIKAKLKTERDMVTMQPRASVLGILGALFK